MKNDYSHTDIDFGQFKEMKEVEPIYPYWRKPTEYELKFGEGAIHYRDFYESEIGYNKKGKLKKWFIAPDDGLRYYRQ